MHCGLHHEPNWACAEAEANSLPNGPTHPMLWLVAYILFLNFPIRKKKLFSSSNFL